AWVLQAIQGYHIDFVSMPVEHFVPREMCLSQEQESLIYSEIKELFGKGAIQELPFTCPGFTSNLFLVPKKGGGVRRVINPRTLNAFLWYQHFQMEGIHCLRDLLQASDWRAKLDLMDDYFKVSTTEEHRDFIQCTWRGK
ncbi:Hypothetical predicted protein, partial [Pelobates cultripes]